MPANPYGQEIGAPVASWVPRPAPSPRAAEGHFAQIEHVEPTRHAADLFQAYAEAPDGRDWTYLSSERPATEEACFAYLSGLAASEDPLHYALIERRSGRALGTAALMRIDRKNGVIELGAIAFSPRLKKSVAGTEAIFLLMSRAFDELGYRRLEWKCDALNALSRRAADRYGFTFEGIFRQALVTKGRNRDTAWYAMLDRDWPTIRETMTAWLAPSNFDADGRQKVRLVARQG